jgi:hypothetical protein
MTRRSVVVAIAVIAIVNIAALVGVMRNRSGEPEATVWLDERELDLLPADAELGSPLLRLRYQNAANDQGQPPRPTPEVVAPNVLDEARLAALGFDCSVPAASAGAAAFYRRVLPRPAFVVFAVGGPAWEPQVTAWQERQRQRIERQIAGGELSGEAVDRAMADIAAGPQRLSRLMPVDAGRDGGALRATYPDRTRFLILPGVVTLHFVAASEAGAASVHGHLMEVFPAVLAAPREVNAALNAFREPPRTPPSRTSAWTPAKLDHAPRYEVQVSVGRTWQPWISEIRPLQRAEGR